MLKERKAKVAGAEPEVGGFWVIWRWAVHLDRKHRGEKQELEVSLTEREEVVLVVRGVSGELAAAEVPSPLLTELNVVSGGDEVRGGGTEIEIRENKRGVQGGGKKEEKEG